MDKTTSTNKEPIHIFVAVAQWVKDNQININLSKN